MDTVKIKILELGEVQKVEESSCYKRLVKYCYEGIVKQHHWYGTEETIEDFYVGDVLEY